MLSGFTCDGGKLRRVTAPSEPEALATAAWIDLQDPTEEESRLVASITGLDVSTREELQEIESSSRLGFENGALYLSMPFLTHVTAGAPRTSPLGFALTEDRLITIRFDKSLLFEHFMDRMPRDATLRLGPLHVFVGLLEAMVDRIADVLEKVQADLDDLSTTIFGDEAGKTGRREEEMLKAALKRIGRAGDLVSRLRDSLLGVSRIVPYVGHVATEWIPADMRPRFKTLRQDIASLSDYDAHLTNKAQFLLDAVLGLINMAQNAIIKVLAVVSVVGVPPTLVASLYGMNFKDMPELDWALGYPYALALIVISAVAPLIWFYRRGWL